MKLFIVTSMIFLIISCSNQENTVLQDQISDYESKIAQLENKNNNYELKIIELENDLKRIQKQLDNLCY